MESMRYHFIFFVCIAFVNKIKISLAEENSTASSGKTTELDNLNQSTPATPRKVPGGLSSLHYTCGYGPEMYLEPGVNNSKPLAKFRFAAHCCPGSRKDDRGICKPHCEGGCGEGYCIKPGVCACRRKHCSYDVKSRTCSCPVCSSGCVDGVCVANHTCRCNPGFRIRDAWTSTYTNSTAQCVPYCFPFCTNNFFVDPKYCECDYSSSEEDSSSIEIKFGKSRKSKKRLNRLFAQHGYSGFAAGTAVGYGLGSSNHHNYGTGGNNGYGTGNNNGQVPMGSYGNVHKPNTVNNYGSGSTHPGTGSSYGWKVPGNNTISGGGYGWNASGKNTSSGNGYGWNVHGAGGTSNGGHAGWVIPGFSGFGTGNSSGSSGSGGSGTGGNYGWSKPGSAAGTNSHGTGSVNSGTNYGWVKPASNTATNTGSSGGSRPNSSSSHGKPNSSSKPGRKPGRG